MPCVNEVKTPINLAYLVIDDLNNTTDDLLYSCFIFERSSLSVPLKNVLSHPVSRRKDTIPRA